MFYDRFAELCNQKKVSRTKACIDCGISRTAWHKWEDGATPNGITLNKFAAYFGVSVGYLLCEETEKAPTVSGERNINMSEVDFAFYNGYKELSDDEQKTLQDMVMLMRQRRAEREGK